MNHTFPGSGCNLSIKEYTTDTSPMHRHNYFELIYVLKGRGIHVINENQFAYGRDDLFLLTPSDTHTFLAHELSELCFIDFTSSYFDRSRPADTDKPELTTFFKQLEYIFQNASHFKGYVHFNEEDKLFSISLVRRLILEWNKTEFLKEIVIQNLLFLLLNIVARYAVPTSPAYLKTLPANKVYEMITYIQHNIYDNGLLTLANLAGHFHFSKEYISTYFKRHSGKSIKEFILDYKLELVRTRLLYSELTISEIAGELNFTDESHLNKAFKKHFCMTAREFRMENRNKI